MKSAANEFGRCPCTGVYQKRTVEVRMSGPGGNVTLPGVQQGACPVCGSRVYKAEMLEILEALFRQVKTDPAPPHPG